MAHNDHYTLFMDALDVVNRSLKENRGEGVYGKLIEGFDKFADKHVSAVALYGDDPAHPFDYFTIKYTAGRFELVERGKGEHNTEWKVSKDYLVSVVENPQEYIDNPAKLDLEWMKHFLPDTVSSLFKKAA
ncbi:hypothetical protein [Pseudomarimonas salicorniae]|uniref:Uncharacterized protein n=1 Tax=Pseudomarimonas salicorniae TaxID=2933270 RepID=A0ABT0GH67_9GAMM|nr:hypothetical protein [Lysobacter sp. CAU 1642]MCK7593884.1 hypothetical protein [Lysobacter sp. CAU 1642]